MQEWNVYLEDEHGDERLIDTVFYDSDCDADYVKRGLVDHDGYDPAIKGQHGRGLTTMKRFRKTRTPAQLDEAIADLARDHVNRWIEKQHTPEDMDNLAYSVIEQMRGRLTADIDTFRRTGKYPQYVE